MWRVRLAMSIVAAAGLIAAAAGAGRATSPSPDGPLYFVAGAIGAAGPAHVYTVQADGSALTQLSFGPDDDLWVAASPAAPQLVVSRDTVAQCGHLFWRGGYDLFSVPADGGSSSRLTDDCPVDETNPAWSPSGRHLVFSSGGAIWIAAANGTSRVRLTCPGGDDDFFPTWSPDGGAIAFTHDQEVDVMNADGTNVRRVATGTTPSFSPDGLRLAYSGSSASPGIHVVSLDGTSDVRLTADPADTDPVWSPSGARIAFARPSASAPEHQVLAAVRPDGTGLTVLVDSLAVQQLDWARVGGPLAVEPTVTAPPTTCSGNPASVQAGSPLGATAVDAATVQPPDRLLVAEVAFRPRALRARKPFTVSLVIRDQEHRAVRNAVVRIEAVTGAARTTPELRSGAAGTLTVRVTPTPQLRLRNGGRLTLAVRVRRPGAPWAGDSSGLRWISVRTIVAR